MEAEITFDLEDYIDSYSENYFHLSQNYPEYIINEYTYTDKVNFLKKIIRKQIGENFFVSKAVLYSLIEEVDDDVKNYLEEINPPDNED